jgi:hydroxymethylpyrimidine/phosphomethylpyrimidine kinase
MTIAGSDSGGGAGIQADLKTFAAHGVFGTSAVTALTAQNTRGVRGVLPVSAEFVALQIEAIVSDIGADAVKTGMLANAAIIEAAAAAITRYHLHPLVVDPVMVAKSGDPLLEGEGREALMRLLLPLASVLTPNLPEAEALCGFPVTNPAQMREAARAIAARGPRCVVIKGGHLEDRRESVDLLFDGTEFEELAAERVATRNTHGTGCTFASAIAARLARGEGLRQAVRGAKDYVTAILAASASLRIGAGHGPMDHLALAGRDRL